MCSSGNILGALAGAGLAVATGGASIPWTTIATAASLGSSVGGMLTAPKAAKPDVAAAGPAPNPVADQSAAQDTARVAATTRKRAIAGGSPRSLLATAGGAMGDTSQAQIGSVTAAPVTKSSLGA